MLQQFITQFSPKSLNVCCIQSFWYCI